MYKTFFFCEQVSAPFLTPPYCHAGFEAGGQNTPSDIAPWYPVGNDEQIWLGTERSSPFDRNPVALHVEVLCESDGDNKCPDGGVGVSNPGFWGMVSLQDWN